MVDTEIWLRLMSISSLYGDDMVRIAHWVAKQSHIDAVVLQQTGLTLRQAQRFLSFPRKSIESSLCWLEQPNHHLIPADSEFYPPQLLATRGVTITSGLARGIDGVAHKAALQVNGVSIAVLGNGLNTIHPRRHARLAASLLEQGGALVSEFPLDVPPLAYNFPRRNRIISGLSKGVLVVEAALRSGSLVTARCALEQGREVFALPGPIGNPGSEGPHWLIKQGAILVTEPEEILENLQFGLHWLPDAPENSFYSPDQQDVALPFPELLANVGDEVTPVDVVAERAGQPVPEVVTQLLELELAGWIAAVPGGYVRLRRACHVRRTNVFV
ncbi:DNA-processing protein DprA [Escherichia coli]|uniref:DNA-processing protein DprA n=1 Tax=Escherichia coli TaxID=562 RepID=UPI000BE33477|nr:DNA-processing protein DprA [Escherichia coli]HAW2169543.1 DNA-protecting protein DprA [Escherichia coli]